jgi:hypothetical protein
VRLIERYRSTKIENVQLKNPFDAVLGSGKMRKASPHIISPHVQKHIPYPRFFPSSHNIIISLRGKINL